MEVLEDSTLHLNVKSSGENIAPNPEEEKQQEPVHQMVILPEMRAEKTLWRISWARLRLDKSHLSSTCGQWKLSRSWEIIVTLIFWLRNLQRKRVLQNPLPPGTDLVAPVEQASKDLAGTSARKFEWS